jgi:RNA polymerase sigma-70 factor (ECF subfamily)
VIDPSETLLIADAVAGKAAAITQLYEATMPAVYRFVYFKVNNETVAEDLTQDIFMAAFKNLKHFRGDASFRNWCYEIARHKIAVLGFDGFNETWICLNVFFKSS